MRSSKSVLLLGPRQVGKSTLIRSLKPELSINLSDEKTYFDFKSNPNELRERIAASQPKTVFIDEIQRHPALLNTIQVILDDAPTSRKIKFYLTGSSARKLKRGQANLLPGRIFSYQLGPLCANELNYTLDTAKALRHGCLPDAYLGKNDGEVQKLLSSYSAIYLKEEIQAEALTRNLDGFSRFISVAAANAGQILDFSKIAKFARIERKNCVRFFEILEDTLIAHRLDVFQKTTADIKKRPKFYFFDPGVLNGLLENFTASDDRKGILFEHLTMTQVLSSAKAYDIPVHLSYFRTRSGYEVDLIIEIRGKTFACEIKTGHVDESEVNKLKKMKTFYPGIDSFFVIIPNGEPRKMGPVTICDLNHFLKKIGL